jgi:hypothetical protein
MDSNKAMNHLLDHPPPPQAPVEDDDLMEIDVDEIIDLTADSRPFRETSSSPMQLDEQVQDCDICADSFPPSNFISLSCKHQLCSACHGRIEKRGTTIVTQASVSYCKCPYCLRVDGIEFGRYLSPSIYSHLVVLTEL